MKRPIITLLTDFGLRDHYVAAMKGVIISICPEARIVDISHGVQPYGIAEGAYTLSRVWETFPLGAIHVVVVDPGVGSSRRPILVEAAGHTFIAPDNGVLALMLDAQPNRRVWHITNQRYFRAEVSQTFHGRDIFAPVAAHLATGVEADRLGEVTNEVTIPASIRPIQISRAKWSGIVLQVDHFGNVITNFLWRDFLSVVENGFELVLNGTRISQYHPNYVHPAPETLFVIPGSGGFLEVSLNQAHAARLLAVVPGAAAELRSIPAEESSGQTGTGTMPL